MEEAGFVLGKSAPKVERTRDRWRDIDSVDEKANPIGDASITVVQRNFTSYTEN